MQITVKLDFKSAIELLNPLCPKCGQKGQKVNIKTVRSLIREEERLPETEMDYYICRTPSCEVAYYSKSGYYIGKNGLTVPIWFKEQSPVPICYCKGVTDTEILEHVAIRQCCSNIEDIQAHTGANTGKDCLTKNPTGK